MTIEQEPTKHYCEREWYVEWLATVLLDSIGVDVCEHLQARMQAVLIDFFNSLEASTAFTWDDFAEVIQQFNNHPAQAQQMQLEEFGKDYWHFATPIREHTVKHD